MTKEELLTIFIIFVVVGVFYAIAYKFFQISVGDIEFTTKRYLLFWVCIIFTCIGHSILWAFLKGFIEG